MNQRDASVVDQGQAVATLTFPPLPKRVAIAQRRAWVLEHCLKGAANGTDLARELGVSYGTVCSDVLALKEEGLLPQGFSFRRRAEYQRRQLVLERCLKGAANGTDLARELGVSYDTVRLDVLALKEEGLLPQGSSFRETLTEEEIRRREQVIIAWTREGLTLQEMGALLGVTRERVRQIRARIERRYGHEVFGWHALVSVQEEASRLGVSTGRLTGLLRSRGVPLVRGPKGQFHVSRDDLDKLRGKPCSGCGVMLPLWTNPLRKFCSDACRVRQDNIRSRGKSAEEVKLEGWRLEAYQLLKEHSLPPNETWLSRKQAVAEAGVTLMQLDLLRTQGMLRTRPHPSRTWRGRPILTFALSELKIVREARKER